MIPRRYTIYLCGVPGTETFLACTSLDVQECPILAFSYLPLVVLYGNIRIWCHCCRGYQVAVVSVSRRIAVVY